MSYRKALRVALRAALEAEFPAATYRPAMAQAGGGKELPEMTVRIAREDTREIDGTHVARHPYVTVFYRMSGGDDLEDDLDDIAAAIEPLVMPILEATPGVQLWGLGTTEFNIEGGAEKRVGSLTMTFEAEFYTPEGTPN
ncbi:hypothetical protein [Vannielia litorea]|uniref:hypothetical protein n=1 Tax=Vannielia litorea TaxID=1217970 RepID=UPI001BCED83E|nr:hypothetical protein [Vannielia litorea]MBS8228408.1 hypothetical protein [Vannielia litorea]